MMVSNQEIEDKLFDFSMQVGRISILCDAEQLLKNSDSQYNSTAEEIKNATNKFYDELILEVCDLYKKQLCGETIKLFDDSLKTNSFQESFYNEDYMKEILHRSKSLYDILDDIDNFLNIYLDKVLTDNLGSNL